MSYSINQETAREVQVDLSGLDASSLKCWVAEGWDPNGDRCQVGWVVGPGWATGFFRGPPTRGKVVHFLQQWKARN